MATKITVRADTGDAIQSIGELSKELQSLGGHASSASQATMEALGKVVESADDLSANTQDAGAAIQEIGETSASLDKAKGALEDVGEAAADAEKSVEKLEEALEAAGSSGQAATTSISEAMAEASAAIHQVSEKAVEAATAVQNVGSESGSSSVDAIKTTVEGAAEAMGKLRETSKGASENVGEVGRKSTELERATTIGMEAVGQFAEKLAEGKGLKGAAEAVLPKLSSLVTLLGGPWGIAITGAVAVLGPLIAGLWDTKEAADAASDATDKHREKTESFTEAVRKRLEAELEWKKKLAEGSQSTLDESFKDAVLGAASIEEAEENLADYKASMRSIQDEIQNLKKATKSAEVYNETVGDVGTPMSDEAYQSALSKIQTLEKSLAKMREKEIDYEVDLQNARTKHAEEQKKLEEAAIARQRTLNKEKEAELELERQKQDAEAQKEADKQAESDRKQQEKDAARAEADAKKQAARAEADAQRRQKELKKQEQEQFKDRDQKAVGALASVPDVVKQDRQGIIDDVSERRFRERQQEIHAKYGKGTAKRDAAFEADIADMERFFPDQFSEGKLTRKKFEKQNEEQEDRYYKQMKADLERERKKIQAQTTRQANTGVLDPEEAMAAQQENVNAAFDKAAQDGMLNRESVEAMKRATEEILRMSEDTAQLREQVAQMSRTLQKKSADNQRRRAQAGGGRG